MNTTIDRKKLKLEVQELFVSKWKIAIGLFLFPILVTLIFGGPWIHRYFENFDTWQHKLVEDANISVNAYNNFVLSQIGIYLGLIIIGILLLLITTSVQFKGLDWIRDPKSKFSPFKYYFTCFRKTTWWEIILISIIMIFFTTLWGLLLVVPGIIKQIAYSQTYFVYKDIADRGESELDKYDFTDFITISRKLMDGHKAEYFVLQLSFIG